MRLVRDQSTINNLTQSINTLTVSLENETQRAIAKEMLIEQGLAAVKFEVIEEKALTIFQVSGQPDWYFISCENDILGVPTSLFVHFQEDDASYKGVFNITGSIISFTTTDNIAGLKASVIYITQTG